MSILVDPFWSISNMHQNKRSPEFGVLMELLLHHPLPIDPDAEGQAINLARYRSSRRAVLGILTAMDEDLATKAKELIRTIPDEYHRLKHGDA